MDALLEAALAVRDNAHAPYSKFRVGAALEAEDGTVFAGCNVENATYGLTICAERNAVFQAFARGHRRFRRIVIVADTAAPTPPCGACRQILYEHCGPDLRVDLANLSGVQRTFRMRDLLPEAFDASFLSDSH